MWIFHNTLSQLLTRIMKISIKKLVELSWWIKCLCCPKVLYCLLSKIASASFEPSSGLWKFTFASICTVLLGQYLGHTYMWKDKMIDEIIKLEGLKLWKAKFYQYQTTCFCCCYNSWLLATSGYNWLHMKCFVKI